MTRPAAPAHTGGAVHYDRALRIVTWLDAFFSCGIVLVGVLVAPLLAAVGVPDGAQLALGLVVIVTSVGLAAFGAVTAVLLALRLREGHYLMPLGLKVPLPPPMHPDFGDRPVPAAPR